MVAHGVGHRSAARQSLPLSVRSELALWSRTLADDFVADAGDPPDLEYGVCAVGRVAADRDSLARVRNDRSSRR